MHMKMAFARSVVPVLGSLVFASTAPALQAAENDTITTDRPDFVESSSTVGKGRFQIETSVARERMNEAGVKTRTLTTPTLLRFGVAERVELRLEGDGYTRERVDDPARGIASRESGWSDVQIGTKWAVHEGEGQVPSVAVLLHAALPSGSSEVRGSGVRPSLRTVFEWELPNDIGVGLMPGVVYDKEDGDRFAAGILAAVISKGWTDRFRTFFEVAGRSIAKSRNGGSVVTYDVGATYLLTKNVQLDAAMFFGANRFSPDFTWTVGLSARF